MQRATIESDPSELRISDAGVDETDSTTVWKGSNIVLKLENDYVEATLGDDGLRFKVHRLAGAPAKKLSVDMDNLNGGGGNKLYRKDTMLE